MFLAKLSFQNVDLRLKIKYCFADLIFKIKKIDRNPADFSNRIESRFLEPARETKIGSRKREVHEIERNRE